jgi:hypothetical protein
VGRGCNNFRGDFFPPGLHQKAGQVLRIFYPIVLGDGLWGLAKRAGWICYHLQIHFCGPIYPRSKVGSFLIKKKQFPVGWNMALGAYNERSPICKWAGNII